MWIPTPVYEKAPHYWLLLGLLFIVVGSYLGLQDGRSFMFGGVAVGIACCLWSIRVFSKRAQSRVDGDEAQAEHQ